MCGRKIFPHEFPVHNAHFKEYTLTSPQPFLVSLKNSWIWAWRWSQEFYWCRADGQHITSDTCQSRWSVCRSRLYWPWALLTTMGSSSLDVFQNRQQWWMSVDGEVKQVSLMTAVSCPHEEAFPAFICAFLTLHVCPEKPELIAWFFFRHSDEIRSLSIPCTEARQLSPGSVLNQIPALSRDWLIG